MSSLVWLNSENSIHTWGIQILSNDKYTVENFIYNQVKDICNQRDCRFFVQGLQLRDYGTSWAFIEFLGEGDSDKILDVIDVFNRHYGKQYYNGEIMFNEPSRELLVELGLF